MIDFIQLVKDLNIELSEKQIMQFNMYYEYLIKENEHVNLTAITDYDGVYLKHFYDSLTLTKVFNFNSNVEICDIGSGAGFPSVPIKIVFPNVNVTIIDSLKKRTDFLEKLASKLHLLDVNIVWKRAEDVKEKFDVVVARAVARLNILSELCIPLVKKGGYFFSMKGSNINEELEEAKKGIGILGGEIKEVVNFVLPTTDNERAIIVVNKTKDTPNKYPRSFSTIKSKPL